MSTQWTEEPPERLAVLVVRDGATPAGADEATAEADGAVLLVGRDTAEAVGELTSARHAWLIEADGVGPAALADAVAPLLEPVGTIILPGSADGRDLAPRLAQALDRALLADATSCGTTEIELARLDALLGILVAVEGPVIVTLLPGLRGVEPANAEPTVVTLDVTVAVSDRDAEFVELLGPDPGTMDLAEAKRIFCGGAGLVRSGADGRAVMTVLGEVANALGASAGATRVVTDAGWQDCSRQIGTTGVVVDPELYVAFGISGASQHTGGLGAPEHIVSVNTDSSSPMTAMADLGIVADAPTVLAELARRLGIEQHAIELDSFLSGRR